jgi:hypothetical protein
MQTNKIEADLPVNDAKIFTIIASFAREIK